jgi:hypothetical protein
MSGIRISNWRGRTSGTLRGYFSVSLPSGLEVHDLSLHTRDGTWWVAMPTKVQISADGTALRDGTTGKLKYGAPIVGFASKEVRDKFSAQVVAALRLVQPEVFAVGGAAL